MIKSHLQFERSTAYTIPLINRKKHGIHSMYLTLIREEYGIQCMPCSSRVISEMLPEIHIMEKYYFLKQIDYM